MHVRFNDITLHHEIVIDIEEITEALQTTEGWRDFTCKIGQLYLEVTRRDKT